jgi:hypothetical protein
MKASRLIWNAGKQEDIEHAARLREKLNSSPESKAETEGRVPAGQEKPVESPKRALTLYLADDRAYIAADVARQLEEAGRTPEDARAAGEVYASNLATYAKMFKGAFGSLRDWYEREGVSQRGQGGRSAPTAPRPVEPSPAANFGNVGKPERPVSLLEFLSSKGLAHSPELQAIFDKENPRFGKRGKLNPAVKSLCARAVVRLIVR